MATLTIRDLPDDVRDKLRVRAAEHGRSMEAEVRKVLAESIERVGSVSATSEGVRKLQAAFAPIRRTGSRAGEEPMADRTAEAAREEALDQAAAESATFTQRQKLERARTLLRTSIPEGTSLVDEFLAERRAMWGDE